MADPKIQHNTANDLLKIIQTLAHYRPIFPDMEANLKQFIVEPQKHLLIQANFHRTEDRERRVHVLASLLEGKLELTPSELCDAVYQAALRNPKVAEAITARLKRAATVREGRLAELDGSGEGQAEANSFWSSSSSSSGTNSSDATPIKDPPSWLLPTTPGGR